MVIIAAKIVLKVTEIVSSHVKRFVYVMLFFHNHYNDYVTFAYLWVHIYNTWTLDWTVDWILDSDSCVLKENKLTFLSLVCDLDSACID